MKDDGINRFIKTYSPCIEKFMDMLIKTNDKAVNDIQAGNLKEALHILERMEKILEVANHLVSPLNFLSMPQSTRKSLTEIWLSFVYTTFHAPIKRISSIHFFTKPSFTACGYSINVQSILMVSFTTLIRV